MNQPVQDSSTPQIREDCQGVKGLAYLPELLTPDEQHSILEQIDAKPWLDDLKRRVQHYGYKYDYKARSVDPSMRLGPLPPFALDVAAKLLEKGLLEKEPDQVIVNEYEPGQGISAHIDCEPCFENVIVTVTLGSGCEMEFLCVNTKEKRFCKLETGSALRMKDDARKNWTHRIRARKQDHGVPRSRRVSLTYRNVILKPESD